MKKIRESIALVLAAIVCAGSSVACSSKPPVLDPPVSLAVVYSQRAGNSTSEHYFDTRLEGEQETLLYRASSPGSEMVVITTSGSPFQGAGNIIPESDAVTSEQARDDQSYYAGKGREEVIGTPANAPEADAFEAVRIAANWLRNQPPEHLKYCLVIDNGICTTGALSFLQDGFLAAEPAEIVRKVAEQEALPDLTGVTVVLAGLGRTAPPQAEPGRTAQKRLEALWELIVAAAGGSAVIVRDCYETVVAEPPYPVSVVCFPPDQPLRFDPETKPEEMDFAQAQFLGDDQVRFIGDSAEFLYPDAAEAVIRPIADYMVANPGFTMLLAGTTAGDETTQYSIDLSKSRADTVMEAMAAMGVPRERMVTVGLGSLDPWHIPGLGTSGPGAAQNRKVVLLSADSPEAADIFGNNIQ